jgi:PAS domain S-box-containing protein
MTRRYLLTLGFIALLSIADYLFIDARRQANEAGASFMIAVGREITLVERIAGLSQFLTNAPDDASRSEIRQKLLASIDEVESVRAITEQSQEASRGRFARFFHLGVKTLPLNNEQVEKYVTAARAIASAKTAELTPNNPSLIAIRNAILENRLTLTLDSVATTYQRERNQDVKRLQSLLRWDLISMIAVLLGSSVLVFRPMTYRIYKEVCELEAAEAYNRAILENAFDGIIATNAQGRIKSMNPAAGRMFGVSGSGATGKSVHEIMPWPGNNESTPQPPGIELRGRRADGSAFPLELTISNASLESGILRIGVVRDISERRRLEEEKLQSERLATIGAMSAALAHEIRNPLGSIMLNLELLKEDIEESGCGSMEAAHEALNLLRPIASQCERIRRITEDYLLFAKMPTFLRSEVSLNAILREGLGFLNPAFDKANIQLLLHIDETLQPLRADPAHLWQAMLNLIRNAMDAMPDGGQLTICTQRHESEQSVSFTDTGLGISGEQQASLFKPFYTTKNTGTGLGLSLVQQIVKEHGGRISCDSVVGKGATFTMYVPQTIVASGNATANGGRIDSLIEA